MAINHELRQLRLARGMTQEQAAERLGVTRQALSSYETGRTRPDLDTLLRLAEVYGTDLEGILYGQEPARRALGQVRRTLWSCWSCWWGFKSSAPLCCGAPTPFSPRRRDRSPLRYGCC